MKKIVMSLALLVLVSLPFFAQNSEENSGEFTYFNVQVLRVYEHKDAYLVLYNKTGTKMGQVAVPKDWFKYNSTNYSRVRSLPEGMHPYMTVIYKDNEFHFYTYPTRKFYSHIDIRIGMCHWEVVCKENSMNGKWVDKDPKIDVPSDAMYYRTWVPEVKNF